MSTGGLFQHIRFSHSKSSKDVYDEFCKKENDGICIICGEPTIFRNGKYRLTCSDKCKAEWYSKDLIRASKISVKKQKYNTETFLAEAKETHPDKFEYPSTKVRLLSDRIEIVCKKHGCFETVASYHLRDSCGGCKLCAAESMVKTRKTWSEEQKEAVKEKRRETNRRKYGNKAGPMPVGSQKYVNSMMEIYGVDNPFKSQLIKEKIKDTNMKRYGVENPSYLEKTIKASHTKQANKKRYLTHKANNSFNASAPEEEFYDFLLTLFEPDDIYRNYADDPRYPFACDFYIRSQDLFIELNLYFTHGFHWFDKEDPEDIDKLKIWQDRSNGKDLYNVAITVWTVSDLKKRDTAINNHLNYVVLWNIADIERYKKELYEHIVFKRINNISEAR